MSVQRCGKGTDCLCVCALDRICSLRACVYVSIHPSMHIQRGSARASPIRSDGRTSSIYRTHSIERCIHQYPHGSGVGDRSVTSASARLLVPKVQFFFLFFSHTAREWEAAARRLRTTLTALQHLRYARGVGLFYLSRRSLLLAYWVCNSAAPPQVL